jgi:hypothetical protein
MTPQGQPAPSPSRRKHHQQSFWQIWVPLGLGILIMLAFLGLAILSAVQGSSELNRWTNVSLMFLILPAVLAGLIFLTLFVGCIYLLGRLLKFLPPYTQLGQAYAFTISKLVRVWADRFLSPFIAFRSYWAGLRVLWRRLF